MTVLRTFLIATWIVWGAVLPIVGGMFVAVQLNVDLGYGALVGGLIALPLAMWGMRLAEQEIARESPPSGTLSTDEKFARSLELRDRVVKILIALAVLAMGLVGLIRGTTVVLLPSQSSNAAGYWTIPGTGGAVVALGMVLFGLGWLILRGRETKRDHWGCGLLLAGLLLFVLGHAIYGFVLLLARING
ncbi:MAG: hypothetical protein KF873_19765 [Gemmataceae bacterium]|nr:hypothetical protein [Gemmataceae bacterium]